MNFLKGNDGLVTSCKACTKEGGRFKRNIKDVWSCQQSTGTSTSSVGSGEMRPSVRAATSVGPARPKELSKEHNDYVEIPAGKFKIGAQPGEEGASDRETQAMITITRPFLMKTTEVTQGDWHFLMQQPPSYYDAACGVDCPAGGVSWIQALEYLNRLSESEGLEQCYNLDDTLAVWTKGLDCLGYRLPTEAEWEYAARSGTKGARYGEVLDIAWTSENSGGTRHPVGQKAPNGFELYDMLGNVWEWTWDGEKYDAFTGPMTDPINGMEHIREAQDRIIRGGSFNNGVTYVRAGHRFQYLANSGSENHGFRPVRTSPPAPSEAPE